MTQDNRQGWSRRLLAQHPALVLSGLYVVASVIGLVYSWTLLRGFGVNFFLYADPSDFFLASLKEPFTWLLALLALGIVLSDNAMSRRVEARRPGRWFRWYGSPRYRQINVIVAATLMMVFLWAFAHEREKELRTGEIDIVELTLADGSAPRSLVVLGTTGRFFLGYESTSNRVVVHPHENVLTITHAAPSQGDSAPAVPPPAAGAGTPVK